MGNHGKWRQGKTFLFSFLSDVIEANNLEDGIYAEPYAGGAGAALKLLYADYVDRIMINDADPCIYSFWASILDERTRSGFLKLLLNTTADMDTWHSQKRIYENHGSHSQLEVGFATFFLNRCNRSGILLKGGPIGGADQTGKWKVDARFNKENLAARIERVGDYADRIELSNLDAIEFLKHRVTTHPERREMLVYLDPPYYKKGEHLYMNHYLDADHAELADFLRGVDGFRWVMTYDNSARINELYDYCRRVEFNLSYSANKAKIGTELLIHTDQVDVPLDPDHLALAATRAASPQSFLASTPG